MRGNPSPEDLPAEEAFARLTLDDLRPLAGLVHPDPPKKKTDLVPILAGVMTDRARVRALYDSLDPLGRHPVRAAVADPAGQLNRERFRAAHGDLPRLRTGPPDREEWELQYDERRHVYPTELRLFFPRHDYVPSDTRALVKEFAPPPDAFALPTREALPDAVTLTAHGSYDLTPPTDVAVRVRATAADAVADVRAVLRLIDARKVKVTDKKRVPNAATRAVVAAVLSGGDFLGPDDADEYDGDPAADVAIKAFAWPLLVQAGGLAEPRGGALALTPAGKRAAAADPPVVLDALWAAWLKTTQFDEFARVDVIKGQERAGLTAVAGRRKAVAAGLAACPVGRWFAADDFFRLLRATGKDFALVRQDFELYIADPQYGSLGYDDRHAWEQLQGRFVLAFLFEIAATLGLVDVAFVAPGGVRHDYQDRWGTDDLSCLSRYDGLLFARVNALGAWVFGHAEAYTPAAPERTAVLRVLPNRDVVAPAPLAAADRLTLERFAEVESDGVWRLTADKLLGLVEEGGSIDEAEQFLAARAIGDVPATVSTFLADLRAKAARLADAGPARLIACADEHVAAELAADRQLRGKCLRAGDRHVVVRDADLAAVRKAARRLGYVWPVPADS